MKNFILYSLLLSFTIPIYSQLSGKKSKNPYKSGIDGYTYKIGDKINIGFPSKGINYQNIAVFDFKSTLDQITNTLAAINGKSTEQVNINAADKSISNFKGEILFFQIQEIDNKKVTFAVVDYKDNKRLAIAIDASLSARELISLSTAYRENLVKNDSKSDTAEMIVKSFDPNFNFKVTSIKGNRNLQTVTISFVISHKLPHQVVGFTDSEQSIAYDFEGNSYPIKEVTLGVNSGFISFMIGNITKIPTNIPIKGTITFKQILPAVSVLSYMSINVTYGPFDGYSSNRQGSNIEISNMKIDWN